MSAAQLDEEIRRGKMLYARFRQFPPDRVLGGRARRCMPPVLVELGELQGLIYRSDRRSPGRPRSFIHFMDDPPKLLADPAGTQLYIVGGNYRVTSRGIEG